MSDDVRGKAGEQPGPDFLRFAERLGRGDQDAACELFARYSSRMLSLARLKVGPRLAVKADAEDVLQSAFRTFFRRLGGGEVELRDWESLSGLLTLLTLRKVLRNAAAYRTRGRDLRLELPPDGGDGPVCVPDRDPSPDEVAAFTEFWESLLGRLPGRDRVILERLMGGDSVEDIAAACGCSRRTVNRTLARIRQSVVPALDR